MTRNMFVQCEIYLSATLHMSNDEIKQWIASEIIIFTKMNIPKINAIDRIIYWRLPQITLSSY